MPRPAPLPAVACVPELGIEIVSVHLIAGGNLVDLRYRVVDPDKAVQLLRKGVHPNLLDPANGLSLMVPTPAYVGPLRQTAVKPHAGKTYFILFGNAAGSVQAGSVVTLAIGDFKVENLKVT